jgi:hypothetical protein
MTIKHFKTLRVEEQRELARHLEALRRHGRRGLHDDELTFLIELEQLETKLGGSLWPQ